MKHLFTRKALIPAMLSAALLPVSMGALAGEKAADHDAGPRHDGGPHEMRGELFDRAGIDADTREALKQAGIEHRDALQELNAEYRSERQAILGEDGITALKQAGQELRNERATALMDEWQLSDADREQLMQTRESLHASIQSLRSEDFENREQRRQAWEELRESHHAQLAEILSEEQIQELKHTMMPRGHAGHGDHEGRGGHRGGDHRDGGNRHAEPSPKA